MKTVEEAAVDAMRTLRAAAKTGATLHVTIDDQESGEASPWTRSISLLFALYLALDELDAALIRAGRKP